MKKIIFSAAALMLASAFSFAGTPETKDAKPVTAEVKSATLFHYASESTAPNAYQNTGNWQPGPSPSENCGQADVKPCEIMANDETDLSSQISGKTNLQVLDLTISNRP